MRPLYLGFFDELEKLATDKDEVNFWKKYYRRWYKGASRRMTGEAANHQAQLNYQTRGRKINPGDPGYEPGVFNITIPKPGKPKERIVGTREQADKRQARIRLHQSSHYPNGDPEYPMNDYAHLPIRRKEEMRARQSLKPKPRVIADPYADAVSSAGGAFKNSPVKPKRYGK